MSITGQLCQKFHDGPPVGHGGGYGLGAGVQASQPGQVAADEPVQLPVAADLARARIIDHHLTRPRILQKAGITLVKRGEVLRDRISLTRGAGLLARQLHTLTKSGNHGIATPRSIAHPALAPAGSRFASGNILIPSATRTKAPTGTASRPITY